VTSFRAFPYMSVKVSSHYVMRGTANNAFAANVAAISPPSHFLATSSLERDFCRQRRTRQKGPEDDVFAQRPEIGDNHTREMATKRAFC